jgi:DNA polymerase-3 subunit gamma/tau
MGTREGARKLLLIENAEKMNDSARTSLLKLLEEPPEHAVIVLSSSHADALIPTILSRLRPYRFAKRSRDTDAEVIRRVFRDEEASLQKPSLAEYLDGFLPVADGAVRQAAALFAAYMLRSSAGRGSGANGDAMVNSVAVESGASKAWVTDFYNRTLKEAFAQPIGGEGEGRPVLPASLGECVRAVMGVSDLAAPGVWNRFLSSLLELAGEGQGIPPLWGTMLSRITREAARGRLVFNLDPQSSLERLGVMWRAEEGRL